MRKTKLLLLALLFCHSAFAVNNVIWPTWLGNAAHTGYVNTTVDFAAIKPLWSIDLPLKAQEIHLSNIIVSQDTIYFFSFTRASPQWRLWAVNAANGKIKWQVDLGSYFPSLLTYDNNKLYFYMINQDTVTGVFAVAYDAVTGNKLFSTPFKLSGYGHYQAPIVDNHQLLFGSPDEELSINTDNGNLQWKVNGLSSNVNGIVYNNYVVRGDGNTLKLLDRQNGQTAFTIDMGTFYTLPLIYDETNHAVYSANNRTLIATDLQNKTIKWQKNFDEYDDIETINTTNNTLYVVSHGGVYLARTLRAINASTGITNWIMTLDSGFLAYHQPVVTNNALIFKELMQIQIISLDNQKVIKTIPLDDSYGNSGQIAVANNVLYYTYYGSSQGNGIAKIYALALN
jgi:hypothetical protein